MRAKIIRPRVDKSKEGQRDRVTKKVEVFAPSWICNAMNSLIDARSLYKKYGITKEEQAFVEPMIKPMA